MVKVISFRKRVCPVSQRVQCWVCGMSAPQWVTKGTITLKYINGGSVGHGSEGCEFKSQGLKQEL